MSRCGYSAQSFEVDSGGLLLSNHTALLLSNHTAKVATC